MLEHGGQLLKAAKEFNIPTSDWVDLSTGINPNTWPVPTLPLACWNRLPENYDQLISVASDYYGCDSILPIAGTQAAIQILPRLRPNCRVAVPFLAYQEHRYQWQQAGHWVSGYDKYSLNSLIDQVDVLIVVNPNNPSGEIIDQKTLLAWHAKLAQRGGWLIVDEAFMDPEPEQSISHICPLPGLIVLRSVGKFFGLAGLRCGFMLAENELLADVEETMGPWAVNHPARWVTTQALQDTQWQMQTRHQLARATKRLKNLLQTYIGYYLGGTALFQSVKTPRANQVFQCLAQQGILVRQINEQLLRFGLPGSATQWQRLSQALGHCKNER